MGEFLVYAAFGGVFLLLFPVFVTLDAYVDVRENKAWFSLSMYGALRLFGGYAQLDPEGIVLHLTKKKAVFIPYSGMGETRKKFEITKGFQLYCLHQILETGGATSPYRALFGGAVHIAGGIAFAVLRTKHPFLSLKNGVLFNEKFCLKLTLQTTVVLNGLVLAIALTKKLLEELINWTRKKRSEASLKKQRSS